jgi:hypothetical protein
MGDDQDFALVATVFQGAARALADIQPPAADHALQNGCAVHAASEQLEFGIIRHGTVLPRLLGTAGCAITPFPASSLREPGDREAGGVQGRRLCRWRPRSGVPCGPTGASGSGLWLISLGHAPQREAHAPKWRMRLAGPCSRRSRQSYGKCTWREVKRSDGSARQRRCDSEIAGWIPTGGEHGDDTLDRRAERSDKQENTRGPAARPELLDQPCLSAFKTGASRRAVDTSAGPT